MSRRIADLLIKIGADSYEFQQKTKQVEKGLDGLSKKLTSVGKNLSLKLTAPLMAMGTMGIMAADGAMKAAAKVQQGIKSTSGAAKLSFEQLNVEADKLEALTLFDGDDILNGATAQLLTFTNIAGDNFKRTQAVALDLATVLQGDLKSASIQLGKALNDPVKNLSALSRSGIQFSKEQTAVIKSLAETGRLAEAQALILDELERQYGGQAEAAAKVGAYSLNELKDAWGKLLDDVGMIILPLFNKVVGVVKDLVAWFQTLSPTTKTVIVVIGGVAAAVGPLLLALGGIVKILPILKAGMLALNTPMMGLIALAAGLAYAFSMAFNSYKELQNLDKTTAQQWVADGTYDVGDIERVKGYIAEYEKKQSDTDNYYQDKLGGFWKNWNGDYRKEMDNAALMANTYREVLVELEKKKKTEEAALANSKKITEEAEKYAEEVAKGLENMTALSDATKDSVAVEVDIERKVAPLVSESIELEPIKAKLEVELPKVAIFSAFEQKMATIRDAVAGSIYSWADSSSKNFDKNIRNTSEVVAHYVDELTSKGWKFSEAISFVTNRINQAMTSAANTVNGFFSDTTMALTETLGKLFAGEDIGLGDFVNVILQQMANFLQQLGAQLIEFGIMIVGFKQALKAILANPWLAIGIGAAMVTAAAVMTSLINKNAEDNIPKLAKGGLAFGTTYAMVGDNPNSSIDPEVIAPLSKLKAMLPERSTTAQNVQITLNGELTAKGRDLVYALTKENFKISLLG